MIDGVKLIAFHQSHQMGKFQGDHALGLDECLHAAHEIADIWNLREYVVAQNQVGLGTPAHNLRCQLLAKELHQCRNSLLGGFLGHVHGRLDAQNRNPFFDKVLEEIAVIAG